MFENTVKNVRLGRPPVYTGRVERHIAKLVREYGATDARTILNAGPLDEVSNQRNKEIVPWGLGISMPTVLKIAHRHGVKLHVGRPRNVA